MFEKIETIVAIVVAGLSIISALWAFFKNLKGKKLADVKNLVKNIVKNAESMYGATKGEQKLSHSLKLVEELCKDRGLSFDSEYWTQEIESLVAILNHNKAPKQ